MQPSLLANLDRGIRGMSKQIPGTLRPEKPINTDAVLAGDRLALARLLTQIENQTEAGRTALNTLFPHTGRAHLIGVTGAPGTGKSSLVNRLAFHYRRPSDGTQPKKVAIVAVDPSSPFSGGAVLGDRIRMRDLSGDPGVFIRSMATRGSLGGLAQATAGMVQVFDAAGFDIILIETVGAGQAEVDIARLAHTTLVVEVPGLGDDIQAIKAGILEIADILVVNKADRAGVENTERALRNMLQLAHPGPRIFQNHHGRPEPAPQPGTPTADPAIWVPLIQRTIATEDRGLVELISSITDHRKYLQTTGELAQRERSRLGRELDLRILSALHAAWETSLEPGEYEASLDQLVLRERAPEEAARALTARWQKEKS